MDPYQTHSVLKIEKINLPLSSPCYCSSINCYSSLLWPDLDSAYRWFRFYRQASSRISLYLILLIYTLFFCLIRNHLTHPIKSIENNDGKIFMTWFEVTHIHLYQTQSKFSPVTHINSLDWRCLEPIIFWLVYQLTVDLFKTLYDKENLYT
jgi:hypothetical protein